MYTSGYTTYKGTGYSCQKPPRSEKRFVDAMQKKPLSLFYTDILFGTIPKRRTAEDDLKTGRTSAVCTLSTMRH